MPYKDPVKAKSYREAWWAKNRDKQIARLRQRYRDNPQYYRQQSAQWYADNPERARELRRQARHRAPWKYMLKSARERAIKKGVEFSLTESWAKERYTGFCEITQIPFLVGKNGCGPASRSPSIDRIVPTLGYTPNNCRFILACVNNFKHDSTEQEMFEVIDAILQYRIKSLRQ